jgi:hypothetical protein
MIPRGEVGLIFANIGLALSLAGKPIIDSTTFSAVVVMVIVTTMATPPALKWSLKRRHAIRWNLGHVQSPATVLHAAAIPRRCSTDRAIGLEFRLRSSINLARGSVRAWTIGVGRSIRAAIAITEQSPTAPSSNWATLRCSSQKKS